MLGAWKGARGWWEGVAKVAFLWATIDKEETLVEAKIQTKGEKWIS